MKYRRMGKSGLQLSEFSLGSWVTFGKQVDVDAAREMMALAYDNGINFFDNAESYAKGRSEQVMGEALHQLSWPRDSYCVSSKVFWGGDKPTQRGLSRKHVTDACHAALKRLGVDYLDLYFCHRPDIETPIEETVRAMHDLVSQGKVLYWGTSEWSARQITEAYAVAAQHHLTPPTVEQPEYNVFNRHKVDHEYLPLFRDYGLGATTWSPLASGVLTGKYRQGIGQQGRLGHAGFEWLRARFESPDGQQQIRLAARLEDLAAEHGLALHHLALLWCLSNPNVSSVILGASAISQLRENLGALDHEARFDTALRDRVEQLLGNRPQPEVAH